jgi:arsenate reductase (glutaredoxin)
MTTPIDLPVVGVAAPGTIRMFGLPNCDQVRRARQWLDARGLAHQFHDFRRDGLPEDELALWLAAAGWEALLNRRGTTWRQLDAALREAVVDEPSAARLMRDKPSLIKRPVVRWPDGALTIGFVPSVYQAHGLRHGAPPG